ncbi:GGDEF domain-containing protein [Saccharospirillum salsuginis]|uniref:diguanylate cyclase n=1 Tax=Saccharospirillum salsuginis TaxID=418750 RepID=A0A918NDV7_9GAMM|nr:GGDEF domain-containing protein [Saccharospirillum salsuginis]GGX60718.1 GGDEF domain-containing protein [Saccharospirillum salsuginis]
MPTSIGQSHKWQERKHLQSTPGDADQLKDFRLQVLTQLQTTLDVEQILRIFHAELQQLVPLAGCDYHLPGQSISLNLGDTGRHRCSYQLSLNDEDYGEIAFTRNRRFQERELTLLESVMGLLIYPLRNALSYRRAIDTAMIDPLTGLSNRGAMAMTLNREIDRSRRHHQDMSILMIDIDHFKALNDRYGHLTGDDVLRQVARLMDGAIRGCDACFRFGGEEFLIVLSNSNLPLARLVAERLRQTVYNETRSPDPNNPITVSIGVAHYENEVDWPELVNRADQALYEAKQAGRNRVVASHVRSVDGEWLL